MPIFGMNTPRGAFAAIVRGLKYEQFPTVEANNGKYKVFPRFFISDPDCNTRAKISRTIAFDPYEDIVVDFYPLPKDATYADIAKVYRNCQLESGTVKPLRERIKGNNALAYTADSIYVRLKHARKKSDPQNPAHRIQTVENEPELEIFFTFEDFLVRREAYPRRNKVSQVSSQGGTALASPLETTNLQQPIRRVESMGYGFFERTPIGETENQP